MKFGKHSCWIIIFAVFIASLVIFLIQVDSVQATFSDIHALHVLIQVDTEILRKTPIGRHYEALLLIHSDELIRILETHPEHQEVMMNAVRLFIPELEALLDGKGDTAYITSEHVESLKAELDWLVSTGSPALREDIQKERKRLQIDNFVGMNMEEALDFVLQADISDIHAFDIFLRVDTEILRKTPAGRYYEGLLLKHGDQLIRILESHPEHSEILANAVRLYIPELEALLDDKGDIVYITSEHVAALKVELDWLVSMGDAALKEDIQRERQRLPLDDFVGMTMSDAWEFINYKWTPDMIVQPTLAPESVAQPTSTPHVADPVLVPGSHGKWAYSVFNGVYFEYPSSYYLRLPEESTISSSMESIYFHPKDVREEREESRTIIVNLGNGPVSQKENLIGYLYSSESIIWKKTVVGEGFEGIEYISSVSNGEVFHLGAILHNQANQVTLHIYVNRFSPVPENADYVAFIDQKYEYFQHMVDKIRMQTP